jgi:hypothetical protein
VTVECRQLTFAGIGAMTCLKALIAWGRHQAAACQNIRHQNQDAIQWLSRMNFFSAEIDWCVPPPDKNFHKHDSRGRFLPIRNLQSEAQTSMAAREIVHCLDIVGQCTANTVKYAVSELLDNAL